MTITRLTLLRILTMTTIEKFVKTIWIRKIRWLYSSDFALSQKSVWAKFVRAHANVD